VCLDELDHLDVKPWVGRDVAAIQHAFLDVITDAKRESGSHLKTIDLTASFLGSNPPLPRPTIYVARWKEGELEGYVSKIGRTGRARSRRVTRQETWGRAGDTCVREIGAPPKLLGKSTSSDLAYEPWTSGTYWVLACKPDYCFVTFSTVHVVF